MRNLITAGELARLSTTTKRTILFYDQKGILKPVRVNSKKYRLYEERQVLDYQMILLLTTLGVSLTEIKKYLRKKGNLQKLFADKKSRLKQEIRQLEFNLNNLEKFMANLKRNGTMVDPKIKHLKPFGVYYVEKVGSYAKIGAYCQELLAMFDDKAKPVTLAIFENPTYQPRKSLIKIGVLAKRGIRVKQQFKDTVSFLKFNPGKVLTHVHQGSGSLLSLFWKELEKYCSLRHLKIRKDVPDFEIYWKVNEKDLTQQVFQIYLPIK